MKNFTFLFLLLANFSLFAQRTYVPDDNFEQALINLGYDSGDLDDYVPTDSISGRTYLNVSRKNISDLTGIEDFSALTELYCYNNQLTSLDVSANKALTLLHCYSNNLTSLDVSANKALTSLGCGLNKLTSLDVAANTALAELYCCDNQLTSLDVTTNTALTLLHCYNNHLTHLDVRNGNNAKLADFKAYDNPDLTCIYVDDNTVSYSNWTKDETATYVNNERECSRWTYVPDDNFEQALIDKGYDSGDLDDYVPTDSISGRTYLNVSGKNISDLTGIEDFSALNILWCYSNQLSSLDVSTNTALTNLFCSDNQLTSLDVTANTALTKLICAANKLTSLDVSANTALNSLYCGYNQLINLDVSANKALTYLDCGNAQLISLDMSANTALTKLYCSNNQLTSLDVRNGNNANLNAFYATGNPDLTCIYVDDNTVSYSNWTKDETATYVNDEAECTALATSGLKNVSGAKTTPAIDELEDVTEFSLFPNPVKAQFTIQTNKQVESLRLYNISGRLVKEFGVQDSYSVSDLSAGVYYLNITCKEEAFTQKLVIE